MTGFLIFRGGYFLQLLEGLESDVRTTLGRIERDSRHSSITVFGEFKSEKRLLPGWSMARVDLTEMSSSSESLIELFDLARAKSVFATKEPLQVVLKLFSENAKLLD